MCEMENRFFSSSFNTVSCCQSVSSWTSKSWDPSYTFRQQRARFQQRQLQEKEEKLLKLFQEQQERAMNRVGSRAQSGGSSVSSTSSVGRGKVRHMFQTRRGIGESKQGRDRSYLLDPISGKSDQSTRTRTHQPEPTANRRKIVASWSNGNFRSCGALGNEDDPRDFYADYNDELSTSGESEASRKNTVRRTQSQIRVQKPKSKLFYFGGSHTDLRFPDELDYVQTFQVIDDHYEIPDRDLIIRKDRGLYHRQEDEFFASNFHNKRRFYENRLRRDSDQLSSDAESYQKMSNVGTNRSNSMNQKEMDNKTAKYKTFVSQKAFNDKPHLKSDVGTGSKTERSLGKETITKQANGTVGRVRKPTMMPSADVPRPQLQQIKTTNVPVRQITKIEGMPPVPASRTTIPRPPSTTTRDKPPISRIVPKSNAEIRSNKTLPQNDLPSCQYCGRHFAEDRIGKHQEICKKSSRTKRKPFDSVKQRIKGTEAEQFLKGGKPRGQSQSQKQSKQPQRDWRKTHEDFISSIRAAREYQVSTSQPQRPPSKRSPITSRFKRQ